MLWIFVERDLEIYKFLRTLLQENRIVIQYVYSKVLPFIYTTTENRGVILKSEFQLKFKEWNYKKQKKTLQLKKIQLFTKRELKLMNLDKN